MAISVPQTASFDVNLAKEVGYPAAILYNQLLFLAQTDMAKKYDDEGWFFYTSNDFNDATGYNQNTFTTAANKLVEAGYIEKKRSYIKHTSVSTTHFRFTKFFKPNSHGVGIGEVTPDVSSYNIEKEIENKTPNHKKSYNVCPDGPTDSSPSPASPSPATRPSSLPQAEPQTEENFSFMTGAERSEAENCFCEGDGRLTNDPFDAPVKDEVLSLKPDRKKTQSSEEQHAWAMTRKVTKIIKDAGHRCPDEYIQLKSAILARIKEGASDAELIKVANNYVNETRVFYKPGDRSPHSAFSADYFYQYLNNDNDSKKQSESIFGRN